MTWDEWSNLQADLRFGANPAIFEDLIKAHQERHRHYHTVNHVRACLAHLNDIRDLLEHPSEVALAFWFHDAVYKPFSSTNERDSADWAVQFLENNHADQSQINRVESLIMATRHNPGSLAGDLAFMVDIDLAILGSRADVYDQYERNIRREYKWVPGVIFRKKRKALLRGFLARDRIYQTDHFAEIWEAPARENLKRAIAGL